MDPVSRQAQRLRELCSKPNPEWSELSLAVTELADAIERLDRRSHSEAICDHLVPLASDFGELLRNLRSKLVSDVCEQLGRIVKTTRSAFTPLANALLDALASTAKASSVAIRNPGFQLFSDVSEYSRYDLRAIYHVYRTSPQERVKTLLLDQLHIVLTYWSKLDIEPHYNEMLEMMRRGLRDPSTKVRTSCRQTFCSFSDLWQDRLDELIEVPTPPARELLMKEKPYAAITKAIRKKYGIESPKNARAKAIREQRAAAQRQGSSESEDDHSAVDVASSPVRPVGRVPAEVSERAPSPGRVSAPSAARRVASPSGRVASPALPSRAPTRVAPPVRVANGTSSTVPPGPARVASPVRVARDTSAAIPAARTASPPSRTSRFGYASPPVRETEFGFNNHVTYPGQHLQDMRTESVPERPQKRVSILESPPIGPATPEAPSPLAQFMESHKPNGSSGRSGIAQPSPGHNKLAAFLETHRPNRVFSHESAPKSDPTSTKPSTFAQFMKAQPPNGQQQEQPPLSDPPISSGVRDEHPSQPSTHSAFNGGAAPRSRYAAAALEFVSQAHGVHPENSRSIDSFTSAPHGDDNYFTNGRSTRAEFGAPLPAQRRSNDVDAFLARPIPTSMPAPEPRAPANVTERGRRQDANESITSKRETFDSRGQNKFQVVVPTSQIEPVPDPSRSDEEPPVVSIDSAFHTMMSSDPVDIPTATPEPLEEYNSAEFEDVNKENQEIYQLRKKVNSQPVEEEKIDALASLGALRAGLKAHLEQPKPNNVVLASKPSHTSTDSRSNEEVQNVRVESTRLAQAEKDQRHSVTETSVGEVNVTPDGANQTQTPAPVLDVRQTPQVDSHQQNHQHTGDSVVRPPIDRIQTTLTTQAVPSRLDHQDNAPSTESKGEHKAAPATDFVRERVPFKFANPPQPTGRGKQDARLPSEVNADQRINSLAGQEKHSDVQAETLSVQTADQSRAPVPQFREHSTPPDQIARHSHSEPVDSNGAKNQLRSHPFSLIQGFPPPPARSVHSQQQPRHEQPIDEQRHDQPRRDQPDATRAPQTPVGVEASHARRQPILQPKPERTQSGVASKMVYSFCLVLGAIFAISGLIQAATKVRDAYEYHNALLHRINQFEASIVESYESVRKMDEKYAVWSEYVRELAEQDESHALHQLESIQLEVEKWQTEMKNDLLAFKQSLSGDIIDAALAPLCEPNATTAGDDPAA